MKNTYIYLLSFVAFFFLNACTSFNSENTNQLELVPYYYKNKLNIFAKDGKWGFMDREKKIIVNAKYKYVQRFFRRDSLFDFTFGYVGDSRYELIDNKGNILEKDIIKWDDVFFQKDTKEWFYRYKNENISLYGKRPTRYLGNKIILHDSLKNVDYLASALPITEITSIKNQIRINELYAIEIKVIRHRSQFREDYEEMEIIEYNDLFYKVTPNAIIEVIQYLYDEDKSLTNRMLILSSYSYVDKAISQKMPSTVNYSSLGYFIDYKKDSSVIYDEEGNYLDKHKGEVKDIVRYKESTLPIYYKDSVEGFSMYLPYSKKMLKNIKYIDDKYDVTYIEAEKDTLIITKNIVVDNLNYCFKEKTLFGIIKNDVPDSIYLIAYEKGISIAIPAYLETTVEDTLVKESARYDVVTIKENTFFYHCMSNGEFVIQECSTGKKIVMKNVGIKGFSEDFSEGFIFLKKGNEMIIMNEEGDIVNSFEVHESTITSTFRNGLALIETIDKNQNPYYIDTEGNKYSVSD